MVTDAQVRRLMEEKAKHGEVGLAAIRAGMHRETARKYLESGRLPSESNAERTWKTSDGAEAFHRQMVALFPDHRGALLLQHEGRFLYK